MDRADVDGVVVALYSTQHMMDRGPGWPAKTCGPSHGSGGRYHRSSNNTPHFMGHGPGRPVKPRGPPHGLGRAAHTKTASHGPRPDPAHQTSSRWVATRHIKVSDDEPRPSPTHQYFHMGRGQTRPIKVPDNGPRSGPVLQIFIF